MSIKWLKTINKFLGTYHLFTAEELEFIDKISHEYMPPRLTEKQWLEAFPEALPLVRSKIKAQITSLKEARNRLWIARDQTLSSRQTQIDIIDETINEINNLLTKLSFKLAPPQPKAQAISENDIAIAKCVPLTDLHPGPFRESGGRIYAHCPWHEDRLPSFVIYKDQNTFCCFSCNVAGDNIRYVMNDQNVSFLDAVKYLLRK
jgi:hypothetical protein